MPILGTVGSSSQKIRYKNVGWWDLNTYSSGTLTDLSGNGYDATYNSAVNAGFISQTFNGRTGRGISGVPNQPAFTISKAYNLTECTIMSVGTQSGPNNGKYAFLVGNSPLTDQLTGTMEGGGGANDLPILYGNGGYQYAANGNGGIAFYTYVLPSSTSAVSSFNIRINGSSAGLGDGGAPTATITHTVGSLMKIDDYNGTGTGIWWEIKVFDKALNLTEIQTEEAYFRTKWGL
jgi:hypothetical protein